MIRRALALVLVPLVAACSTVRLGREDVPAVVIGAFDAAGLEVDRVRVADDAVEGLWPVTVVESGRTLDLEVDPGAGRVVRINLGEANGLSRAELEDIARFRSNPEDDRAQRRRQTLVVALFAALAAVGLVAARRVRLREEAALAEAAVDDEPDERR